MKKIFTLLFLGNFVCSFSQSFNLINGTNFEGGAYDVASGVTILGNDSLYAYGIQNKVSFDKLRSYFQKVDLTTGKIVSEKELPTECKNYSEAYALNGKIFFCTSKNVSNKCSYYSQQYDVKTGESVGEPVLEYEANTKTALFNMSYQKFKTYFSPDKSKRLIVSEYQQENNPQIVNAKLIDTKTSAVIWDKTFPSFYANSSIVVLDIKISNPGSVVYTFRYIYNKQYDNAYGLTLIAQGKEPVTYAAPHIGSNGGPVLELFGDRAVYFSSFNYPRGEKEHQEEGYYIMALNTTTGEKLKEIEERLAPVLLSQMCGKSYPADGLTSFYAIKTIAIKADYYFILERYPSSWPAKELIIYKYNSAWNREWIKLIPKNSNKDHESAFILQEFDKIFFLYTDNPENHTLDFSTYKIGSFKKTPDLQKSALLWSAIDANGFITRGKIDSPGDIKMFDSPYQAYFKNVRSLWVISKVDKKNRRHSILKLTE